MNMGKWMLAAAFLLAPASVQAQQSPPPEKIIIDTDIGDDIDDAFAVALALRSPAFEVLGFTTDFGDTLARAKVLDRMLGELGRGDIPVAVGAPTAMNPGGFTQRAYGEQGRFARAVHPGAVDFILEQIRRHPGEITLVAIGPEPNIGALIDKDPATFRKLKRVVLMGGSIAALRDPFGSAPPIAPHPEWNIKNDIAAAQKLFTSGVPLTVMPLDSTANLKLDEIKRNLLFAQGTPTTDALALLYHQWVYGTHGQVTPTLFDPMTLAWMLEPKLCPVQPMHIVVDDSGLTRVAAGTPNAQVCLHSDAEEFSRFILHRLIDGAVPLR
jgi:inosine-uridine nucleoside N-ribohydrolase